MPGLVVPGRPARLAFVRARPSAPPAIYELDLETRAVRLLAERAVAPAYSPDGERLAFVSDRDRNGKVDAGENGDSSAAELYVANADGSDPHRLTKTVNLDERTPSWSPDGSQLVYARQGPARFTEQLMVIDVDGRNAERIAGNAASNAQGSFRQPAWAPS